MDFSNRLIIERGKRARPRVAFRTKFKAQRSGFEFERRNGVVECSILRKPQAATGNGTERMPNSTKIKLIRAQGECLGIRSR